MLQIGNSHFVTPARCQRLQYQITGNIIEQKVYVHARNLYRMQTVACFSYHQLDINNEVFCVKTNQSSPKKRKKKYSRFPHLTYKFADSFPDILTASY